MSSTATEERPTTRKLAAGRRTEVGAPRSRAPSPRLRVRMLIAHADPLTQLGLQALFAREEWVEQCVVARTAGEALQLTQRYDPHVAFVDLALESPLGTEVARRMRALAPKLRLLALVSSPVELSADAASAAGASGFVSRAWPPRKMLEAVRRAVVDDAVSMSELLQAQQLSRREREVLDLMAGGSTNAEIAGRLFLSPHTVKEHTSAIYRKLKARNRVEAVQRAQCVGILQEA